MVRKHTWASRARMKRTRPKTPAPTNGWLIGELAKLTDFPETTLRYYGAQKLIRPIQRRGTATRYGRDDLMLLLGLARLKTDETSTLADKKRKLAAMGVAELERWLREGPLPDRAAQALGFQSVPQPSAKSPAAATGDLAMNDARFEQWQRIPLLPGLDLILRTDANKAARAAAHRIYEQYVRPLARRGRGVGVWGRPLLHVNVRLRRVGHAAADVKTRVRRLVVR
jgi:DNA-binding transcriptional MerR regulator